RHEARHGSAPELPVAVVANPITMISSLAMCLR
ncbi:MAG: hypothetical protein KGL42_15965, partial [Betaproteobacteria bacterium]|nr:hypothetical protein [Betaproteobacteria bacterium]